MARLPVRWFEITRLRYFDDLGIVTTGSPIRDALAAFAAVQDALVLTLDMEKAKCGAQLEFLEVTARVVMVGDVCQATCRCHQRGANN